MSQNRKLIIDAIMQNDLPQLRILKYGMPPLKTYHTEYGTETYYDEEGNLVSREGMDKDKHLFPSGYISAIVIVYPIGTDVLAHLKNEKEPVPSAISYPANRKLL